MAKSQQKAVIQNIKELTKCSDEEIAFVLQECNGDANECVAQLLER
jgi:hypothetical protein